MFTIVATEIASHHRTAIVVFDQSGTAVESATVYSEWPEDWNTALWALGYDVRSAWVAGAPMWVGRPGIDDHEWTTRDAIKL